MRMNRECVEVLVSTESLPPKDRREAREARVGGAEGKRGGIGAAAVKLHLQNFTARLGAGFGEGDGRYGRGMGGMGGMGEGDGRYGEMRLEMAKGVVEVVKEQRTHVTVELERPSQGYHNPSVSVRYLEWPSSEQDIYPRLADVSHEGGERESDWSDFSLRVPSRTPESDHLFFCLHTLALDYTSGGRGVAGGGIMHSSPGKSWPVGTRHWESCFSRCVLGRHGIGLKSCYSDVGPLKQPSML